MTQSCHHRGSAMNLTFGRGQMRQFNESDLGSGMIAFMDTTAAQHCPASTHVLSFARTCVHICIHECPSTTRRTHCTQAPLMATATASCAVLLRVGPHAPSTAPSATTWPMNSTCASRHGQERSQLRMLVDCNHQKKRGRQQNLRQEPHEP